MTTPKPGNPGLANQLATALYGPDYDKRAKARRRRRRTLDLIVGTALALVGAWLLSAAMGHATEAPAFWIVVALLGAFFVFAGVVVVGDLK